MLILPICADASCTHPFQTLESRSIGFYDDSGHEVDYVWQCIDCGAYEYDTLWSSHTGSSSCSECSWSCSHSSMSTVDSYVSYYDDSGHELDVVYECDTCERNFHDTYVEDHTMVAFGNDLQCLNAICSYVNYRPEASNLIVPEISQSRTIDVSWSFNDQNGDDQEEFQLEYSKDSSFSSGVTGLSGYSQFFTQVTLPSDGNWYVRVRASDHDLWSDYVTSVSHVDITDPVILDTGLTLVGPNYQGIVSVNSNVYDNLDLRKAWIKVVSPGLSRDLGLKQMSGNEILPFNLEFSIYNQNLEPGVYEVEIWLEDRAGNVGSYAVGSISVPYTASVAGIEVFDPHDSTRVAGSGETLYLLDVSDETTISVTAVKSDPSLEWRWMWPRWIRGEERIGIPGFAQSRSLPISQAPFYVYDIDGNEHGVNVLIESSSGTSDSIDYKISSVLDVVSGIVGSFGLDIELTPSTTVKVKPVTITGSPNLGEERLVSYKVEAFFGTDTGDDGDNGKIIPPGKEFSFFGGRVAAGIGPYVKAGFSISAELEMMATEKNGIKEVHVPKSILGVSAGTEIGVKAYAILGKILGTKVEGGVILPAITAAIESDLEDNALNYKLSAGSVSLTGDFEIEFLGFGWSPQKPYELTLWEGGLNKEDVLISIPSAEEIYNLGL